MNLIIVHGISRKSWNYSRYASLQTIEVDALFLYKQLTTLLTQQTISLFFKTEQKKYKKDKVLNMIFLNFLL